MPKVARQQQEFPPWSEVSRYGISRLEPGREVELHFHDCNEYWIIIDGRGTATSEGVTYELSPGDMLLTKAGDEHSLIVHEKMIAVYFYGIMPPGGRLGHLRRGIDPPLEEHLRNSKIRRTPAE